MSDFVTIWQSFFSVVVALWNWLLGFSNGLIVALIIVVIMLTTLKRIFFEPVEKEK